MRFSIFPAISVTILHVPHQFGSEEQQLVLNVFDSQLCSPSEENLRGKPAQETMHNYAVDYVHISTFFPFFFFLNLPC